MKTIAVMGHENLAAAITARMKAAFPDATIVTIGKLADRPTGAEVACVGLPNYVPTSAEVKVHNFGTKMVQNATDDQRLEQWNTIRDKESTVEAILAELSDPVAYVIQPEAALASKKLAVAEARLKIAEAETDAEKIEGLKALVKSLV